jgi:hypothetical protein
VTLKIQPGIAVTGPAVSDVVHLLAEVIENATVYSSKDTPVRVAAQDLPSGGVLIEVSDSGVGLPEARLAELNWRLDNPPVMDVSVSRHMGLFAVARLAERHGVRVRLRPGSPHGLTALVWLPDSVTERDVSLYGARSRTFATQTGFPGRRAAGMPTRPVPDAQPASHRRDVVVPEHAGTSADETVPAAATAATQDWFRGYSPSAAGPVRASGTEEWAAGRYAAQLIAQPVRGDLTAAGLPTRIPQANLIPGSASGGRPAGSGGTGYPGPGYDTQGPATPLSPQVARSRLGGFQSGGRRAMGQTENSPEGAE